MSTPAGDGGLIGDATIRVDGDTDPATRALRQFSRDVNGRLRDVRGRFVSESALINNSLTRAAGGGDRFNLSLRGIASVAGSAAGILGRVGLSLGAVGAAAGSAAPLLAGIVTTLQNIAPAGAVAVTGMLAVTQASAAIKLGMVGVEDAVSAALDPSKAEEFSEALGKLAPNARAFAEQVRELQPAFQQLQQGVQNRLFAGFADELSRLADSVLPVVRTNLNATATTLNKMALGASTAARQLATDGTLGKAMAGANKGLSNLQKIPGQVVTGLGQLAAAGAPAFDRLTAAAGNFATGISERLSTAFESGALENAVNTAVDLLKDLGTVAGNVFSILGNIMAPVQQAGGGLIGVLLEITGALKEATATQGFQDAISSLASVMATLARTVGPLLGQALAAIGPVFTTLGPPVERLITNLGAALSPIIDALGPVLAAAADAVGILVDALSPLLPVVGDLIASLLPPLVPLLESVGDIFTQAAPVVQLLADVLADALAPIIAQLPAIITPLATHLSEMAEQIFPLLADLIVQLAPSFAQMGAALGQVLVAAGPLLTVISGLILKFASGLIPALTPLIGLIGDLAALFAGHLANVLTKVVVPAISTITALLTGDFSGAWEGAKSIVSGAITTMTDLFKKLPGLILNALSTLVQVVTAPFRGLFNVLVGNSIVPDMINAIVRVFAGLPRRALSAVTGLVSMLAGLASRAMSGFLRALSSGASSAIGFMGGLPRRILGVLGSVSGLLYSAGRSIVQGLINGIKSLAGSVKDAVGSVLDGARNLLPFSPAKEGPFSGKGWTLFSGQSISEALAEGITQRAAMVERAARMVAATAQTTISGPALAAAPAAVADLGVGTVRATGAGAAPTVVNVTVNLTNRGVLGSPFEVENWLIGALDNARRTGRLPALNGS